MPSRNLFFCANTTGCGNGAKVKIKINANIQFPLFKQIPASMNLSIVECLGYLAASLTTISFVPQAWQIWKRRSAEGVSLGMYSIFVSGIGAWLIYGGLIGSWPLVFSNAITFLLSGMILLMKLRFG